MTLSEVEGIMGKPKSMQMVDNKMIARYNLQEMWKGYVPYDMVFNQADQTLVSWSENTKAFEQQQAQLKLIADEVDKQVPVPQNQGTEGSGTPPSFENNPEMMKYFSGAWYSFNAVGGGQTGGTERKLSLCSDGKYSSSSESGYSGDAGTGGAWGTANQGGGGGTWRITGTKTAGTIVLTNSGGRSTTYKYESCGNGCIYLGSIKYAYAGAPQCR
jgi:hypothetical protein